MRGTAFQITGDAFHYWIVVAEKNGQVLALNLTDVKNCSHSPCIFRTGEHPIITKDSAVNYRKAREFSAAKLQEEFGRGTNVKPLSSFDDSLTKRMIEGAQRSDDLTARLLNYFR